VCLLLALYQVTELPFGQQAVVGSRIVVSVPRPDRLQIFVQDPVHHLDDIFAQRRQKLPAMKRPPTCYIEVRGVGVRADYEVLTRGDCVPANNQ